MVEYPVVRRIYIDSGPAGFGAQGDQIIVFKLEGTRGLPVLADHSFYSFEAHPMGTITASTAALSNITHLPLESAPRFGYDRTPMKGNECSDLIGIYWALDSLGPVLEGNTVEVVGDGQVFDMLQGDGRVGARWGGKDWTPDLTQRIREAERSFQLVRYRTIASAANPAGNLVDEVKARIGSRPRKVDTSE
jgi:hypothetical protein